MPYIRAPFATNGDKEAVPVAAQTDGSISYVQGYPTAYSLDPNTDPSARRIERTKMNQLFYDITTAVQEIQQSGVAPYITAAQNGGTAYAYAAGAVVMYNGVVYQSLTANNTSLPTVTTAWSMVSNQNNSLPIRSGTYAGDVNAVLLPGIYSVTAAAANIPVASLGILEHYAHNGGVGYVQVYHSANTGNVAYQRTGTAVSGNVNWSAWKQFATADTLGTAAARNVGNTAGSTQIPDMTYFTSGTSGTAGWAKLPNGFILQWGYIVTSSSAQVNVPFPIAFTTAASGGGANYSLTATAAANISATASGSTLNAISGLRTFNTAGTQQSNGVFWMAMGF